MELGTIGYLSFVLQLQLCLMRMSALSLVEQCFEHVWILYIVILLLLISEVRLLLSKSKLNVIKKLKVVATESQRTVNLDVIRS